MLMGIYGLQGSPANLSHSWSELLLDESELPEINYKFEDAQEVGQLLDHVTCHADGRIHIKTRSKELYIHKVQHLEPLGSDTGPFLRFIAITDRVSSYAAITGQPKQPSATLKTPDESVVWSLRGSFSGSNYALEAETFATIEQLSGGRSVMQPAIILRSGTVKGLIWGYPSHPPSDHMDARPSGTLLSFKFPAPEGKWIIKTFLFQ